MTWNPDALAKQAAEWDDLAKGSYNAGRFDALNAEQRMSPSAVKQRIERAIANHDADAEAYARGYLSVGAR